MPQQLLYPDIARYTEQVMRYIDAFGRANVHVMIYDDFRDNPAQEFKHILQFLGVNPDFRPHLNPVNSYREVRCRRLQGETQLPSLLTRSLLRALPDRYAYLALIHLATWNSRPGQRKALRPAFRESLVEEFSGEVKRLGQLLDRDLSTWT